MWCLPPFLPKAPSQGSNGILVEVISGLSIETCSRWGISSINSVYYPKNKSKKLKSKEKPFEKLVIEPPKEEIFEKLPYPDSDLDDDGEEFSNSGSNTANAANAAAGESKNKSKTSQIPQEYPWNLTYPGKIQLEVVFKYAHDLSSQVNEVFNLFTTEIENIIQYMNSSTNWSIHQIRVPISTTSSPDDQKVLIYPISRLRTGDENLKQNFRKRVNKVGLCWIDAAVLLVDPSNSNNNNSNNTDTNNTDNNTNNNNNTAYYNGKYGMMKYEQLINLFKQQNNNNDNKIEKHNLSYAST